MLVAGERDGAGGAPCCQRRGCRATVKSLVGSAGRSVCARPGCAAVDAASGTLPSPRGSRQSAVGRGGQPAGDRRQAARGDRPASTLHPAGDLRRVPWVKQFPWVVVWRSVEVSHGAPMLGQRIRVSRNWRGFLTGRPGFRRLRHRRRDGSMRGRMEQCCHRSPGRRALARSHTGGYNRPTPSSEEPPACHPKSSPSSRRTAFCAPAINMSNFLLVTGRSAAGDPEGVSPSMARAIAERLGVPVKYVPFPKPGELADVVDNDAWDIGLIGAEPARAEKIAFTAAYAEIEATYLVPAGSAIAAIAEVDRPGVRIAVSRAQRLRPLAGTQYQARNAGPLRRPGRRRREIPARRAGGVGWPAPGVAVRRAEDARRADPGRAVHRGAAGNRHAAQECRGRRSSCGSSSRRRRRRAWWQASSRSTR